LEFPDENGCQANLLIDEHIDQTIAGQFDNNGGNPSGRQGKKSSKFI
jgi:hypothetical protein